ncbi:MAG: ATP-binding cassette domain-containing protein, partial [Campylobacter concisus]|nr:ATP-binding cassette domain-containing protein [Campylobacter concisus]
MKDIIKIRNLNFSYDKQVVLEDINLDYSSDEFLAIIGPNGGGKSTLLKLILGLLKPQSGEIKLFGKEPSEVSKFIGYVPQNFLSNQSFPMMVLEVVLMGLIDKKIFGFYSKDEKALALSALEKVDMREFANARIGELSGGQRQRVYIARALCANAKVLILDEPTASIDTKGQAEIYEILKG